MLRFGVAKPQYVLLLTLIADKKYVCRKRNRKKVVSKLDLNSVPSACEARALSSELQRGVDWAAHASKASVDYN